MGQNSSVNQTVYKLETWELDDAATWSSAAKWRSPRNYSLAQGPVLETYPKIRDDQWGWTPKVLVAARCVKTSTSSKYNVVQILTHTTTPSGTSLIQSSSFTWNPHEERTFLRIEGAQKLVPNFASETDIALTGRPPDDIMHKDRDQEGPAAPNYLSCNGISRILTQLRWRRIDIATMITVNRLGTAVSPGVSTREPKSVCSCTFTSN